MDSEKGQTERIIVIKGIKIDGGRIQLDMTNDGNVENARPKDTITWIIETEDVLDIQYIRKPGSVDEIFKEKPEKKDRKKWSGKIKDKLNKTKEEEDYTLQFTTVKGEKGDHDPKISVNN